LGAIFVAGVNRRLSLGLLWESLGSTAMISGMILLIMASSKLFSQLLAFSGGATAVTNLVVALDFSPLIMLIILLALPFVLCMFVDQIAIMLIVIPIYLPVIAHLGFDPIWFWMIFLVVITIGGITPPFGYTLFALKGAWTEGRLSTVFSSAWPFVLIFLLGIAIMIALPSIVTFLPSLI
ncbi:MAG: TRAP transporter large permease subunit, partial [Roseovarius sp.]|nr:TRAP transporter large permease subunit [Roseovarius sp.]